METIPALSTDLIDMLDKLFPERSAERGNTLPDLMYEAGQRSVVRMLLQRRKNMEEEAMATVTVGSPDGPQ